jgi:CPA1 family monovalent cation:H+ antiporter
VTPESSLVLLFAIATAVAIAVRHLRVPYTVALVIAGLALGGFHVVDAPHLTKDLLFAIFLPGLLFDAAFNLDAREFWQNRLAISALAVPGVIVGILLTGFMVTWAIAAFGLDPGFDWRFGLVFGALVAATDPIAVVALFRDLNAPTRLRVLVEGESLLNDGTAIVLFTIILGYVGGTTSSGGALVLSFVMIVFGGALVGAVLGFGASRVIARIDDAMIEIALTTIAAYGSFIVGESLHYSGVIATVTAGMICGNYGRRIGMSPTTQIAVHTFWEYVAFALNSVIFLLIGFEVGLAQLSHSWKVIAVAFVAVVAGRGGVMVAVTLLLNRTREHVPRAWTAVLTWGGLRGALSMVLVLALAADFPERQLLVSMTFGVVVASILIQGLTMPFVLRRFGLIRDRDDRLAYDLARGRLQVASAAAQEVDRMRTAHAATPELLDALRGRYVDRQEQARNELMKLHRDKRELGAEAAATAIEHLLLVERTELTDRLRSGLLTRDAFNRLAADVDDRLVRVRSGEMTNIDQLLAAADVGARTFAPSASPDAGTPGTGATDQPHE